MKYLFLGGFFTKEAYNEIRDKSVGPIANANNKFQWALISGFTKILGNDFGSISCPQIGAFPKRYKSLSYTPNIKNRHWNNGTLEIGFFNLIGLKHLSRYKVVKSQLKRWLSEQKEDKTLIIYDLHAPFLFAAHVLRKKCKFKICVVIPDLPGYVDNKQNFLYNILGHIEKYFLEKSLKSVDSYVLLTKHMVERLPVLDKRTIVVEGIFDDFDMISDKEVPYIHNGERRILYTGALTERNGLMNLIEAFKTLKEQDLKLVICGDGPLSKYAEQQKALDNRIEYLGQLGKEEIANEQKSAFLMINPRTAEGEFTKYSFPSKTMEYFASQTPVIMYRLPGVPEEYYHYCYQASGNTAIELNKSISYVLNRPGEELEKKCLEAKKFVLENKNAEIQCTRILDMIGKK